MVRGMRIRTAEQSAETYKTLYRAAEESNTSALKALIDAGNRIEEALKGQHP